MRRRALLATAGSAVGFPLSGCLSGRVQPKEHPTIPDPLSAERALEFAGEYAEVELHNSMISERTTEISIVCHPFLDREADGGFYVVANCGGSASVREGFASESVGEIGVHLFPLFVDDRRVVAIDRTRIDTRSDSRASGDPGCGFQVLNFSEAEREATVTISSSDDPAEDPLFRESFSLEAVSGVRYGGIIEEPGTYEFDVALAGARAARYEWEHADRDELVAVGAYVSPRGDLDVDELPDA